MPTSKPLYTAAFRQQTVELALAGRGLKQLAREFGVSASSIRNGVGLAKWGHGAVRGAATEAGPLSASERRELIELRRKRRQVQQERDILAKATAWFVCKSERTSTTSTNS